MNVKEIDDTLCSLEFIDRLHLSDSVHGVWMNIGAEENSSVEVEVLPTTSDDEVASLGVPSKVSVSGSSLSVSVTRSEVARALSVSGKAPPYLCGARAWGAGLAGYGTYGWALWHNEPGRLLALSNWHVFCAKGNETNIGSDVFIDGNPVAQLSSFIPVYFGRHQNEWDFALASFRDRSEAAARFVDCTPATTPILPMDTAQAGASVPVGEQFYTVGARGPTMGRGKLRGAGFVRVNYDGKIARFKRQYRFDKMADPGDSGSIVVHAKTNRVWGLMFAGTSRSSIANPLNTFNFGITGTRKLDGGSVPAASIDGLSVLRYGNEHALTERHELVEQALVGGSKVPPISRFVQNRSLHEARFVEYWGANPDWIKIEVTEGSRAFRIKRYYWVHVSSPTLFCSS